MSRVRRGAPRGAAGRHECRERSGLAATCNCASQTAHRGRTRRKPRNRRCSRRTCASQARIGLDDPRSPCHGSLLQSGKHVSGRRRAAVRAANDRAWPRPATVLPRLQTGVEPGENHGTGGARGERVPPRHESASTIPRPPRHDSLLQSGKHVSGRRRRRYEPAPSHGSLLQSGKHVSGRRRRDEHAPSPRPPE